MQLYVDTLTAADERPLQDMLARLAPMLSTFGRNPLPIEQTLLRDLTDGVDADLTNTSERQEQQRLSQRIREVEQRRRQALADVEQSKAAFESSVAAGNDDAIRQARSAWLAAQALEGTFVEELRILGELAGRADDAVRLKRSELLEARHETLRTRLIARRIELLEQLRPVMLGPSVLDPVNELMAALDVLNIIGPNLTHLQRWKHFSERTTNAVQMAFPEGDPFERSERS